MIILNCWAVRFSKSMFSYNHHKLYILRSVVNKTRVAIIINWRRIQLSYVYNMIMEECIEQLAPRIACFVKTLMKDGKLGVTGSCARIVDVNTGWALNMSSFLSVVTFRKFSVVQFLISSRFPLFFFFLLDCPRFSTEFGKRSVSYLAPTVWNDLPLDTRLSPTIDTFKRRLTTFLFA